VQLSYQTVAALVLQYHVDEELRQSYVWQLSTHSEGDTMSHENTVVQLKDDTTGFHDFETGFDINRSQRKPLGKTIGRATAIALQHGRLIRVEVAEESKQSKPKQQQQPGQENK
jgi:hypothetical protein